MLREVRPALELVNSQMQAGEVFDTGDGRDAGAAVISAVIPCLDEEDAIATVVAGVLARGVSEVFVVDGCSHDRTVERAKAAGARVVIEPRPGYGRAIQAGIAAARPDADILLFLDGDGSDPIEFIPDLIAPIAAGRAVFVQGSRVRGKREPGSLSARCSDDRRSFAT